MLRCPPLSRPPAPGGSTGCPPSLHGSSSLLGRLYLDFTLNLARCSDIISKKPSTLFVIEHPFWELEISPPHWLEDSFLEGPVYRPGVRPPCAQCSAPQSSWRACSQSCKETGSHSAGDPRPARLPAGLSTSRGRAAPRHPRSCSPQMFDEYPLRYSEWGSSNASKIR